ncbi:hypothetical protein K7432_009934 [Basidiobolus ranarum]|uniref:Cytidyltransferase-like domain-containing protein n=1 Tax=Basidiobolus ranarum TaxID=34480 RepID=A0ABR2VWF8_9FUNG
MSISPYRRSYIWRTHSSSLRTFDVRVKSIPLVFMENIDRARMSKNVLLYLPLEKLTSITVSSLNLIHSTVQHSTRSLTILVDCPDILTHEKLPIVVWEEVQELLSTIYVKATKAAQEAKRPLLDVDVLFKDWCGYNFALDKEREYTCWVSLSKHEQSLASFNSQRENAGLNPIPVYIIPEEKVGVEKLPVGENLQENIVGTTRISNTDKYYPNVAVGGTFDHLHAGHKILLTMSAWLTGVRLICGVTGAEMLTKKKYAHLVQPLETRIKETQRFLNRIRLGLVYEVVPIHDTCGPTSEDPDIQAIVVSKETLPGAYEINKQRSSRSYEELDIKVIEVISNSSKALAEDELKHLKLSSTQIREYLELHPDIKESLYSDL